jgi:hypothetical protein
MLKFLKELKQAIKEGWKEGKAELAEEEAGAEKWARIARIPLNERFAVALAAPWRAVFFWDRYSIFKDNDDDKDDYPLHLYIFGEPDLLT